MNPNPCTLRNPLGHPRVVLALFGPPGVGRKRQPQALLQRDVRSYTGVLATPKTYRPLTEKWARRFCENSASLWPRTKGCSSPKETASSCSGFTPRSIKY
jgi:hypothetical protein